MSRKITFEQYYETLDRNDLNDYTFEKETYEGVTKKMWIQHRCGKRFDMSPKNFRNGQSCPKCANLKRKEANKKQPDQEIIVELNKLGFNIKKFNGITKKNLFTHDSCGSDFPMTINELLNTKACPYCSVPKVTKINKNWRKYDEKLKEVGIRVIPEYFHSTVKKSKFKCSSCGSSVNGYYYNLLNGSAKCKCKKRHSSFNLDYYKQKLVDSNLDNEYSFLDDTFVDGTTSMKIEHKKCGTIFDKTPVDFFSNGQHCPKCAKENKGYTEDEVKTILKKSDFELLSEYKNTHTPILVKCTICGNEDKKTLNNIKNNNSKCKCKDTSSVGEAKIFNYLRTKKIQFTSQKTFKDLTYKGNLKFDFFLEDYNLAIEFDGIQHFEPVKFFGGEEEFKKIQKRDKKKNKYCKDNNISLIRISYKDINNIENILDSIII